MSELEQSKEDKIVEDLIINLETYKVQLTNAFISQPEIVTTINSDNTKNKNNMAEALKKWGILRNGGFKALRKYNNRVEEMDKLKQEYRDDMKVLVQGFESKLRELMEEFDNLVINTIIDSKLFVEIVTNPDFCDGKGMQL